MSTLLIITYGIWFIAHLILLVRAAKDNITKKWQFLFASEAAAAAIALALMFYFDNRPGGMFGGFTYIGEVISSMGSAIAEASLLVISLITMAIRKHSSR